MNDIKKNMKRIFSLVMAALFTLPMSGFAAKVIGTAAPFLPPDSDNAYIIFGDEIQTNKMEFMDGLKQGVTEPEDPLYSEKYEVDSVKARYFIKGNYAYFRLDSNFYRPDDSNFLIKVSYYDFGPLVGYFHVDYNSSDTSVADMNYKRVSIQKPAAIPSAWRTANVVVTDANFGGKMEFGADLRLANNAFNAFAQIEIVNLDAARRNGQDVMLDPFNQEQAEVLHKLGLYDGGTTDDGEWDPESEKVITRIEMLKRVLNAAGLEEAAESYNGSTRFGDVYGDALRTVGYAESIGLIQGMGDGVFEPGNIATARQLLTVCLRLLGFEGNLYGNAIELGKDYLLIREENFLLFPDGSLYGDQFAGIIYNALLAQGADTRTLISRLLESGILTQEQLDSSGSFALAAQKYMTPTKLPSKEIYDSETERTYHYINFEGGMAFQCYFNRQNWSSDSKRFLLGSNLTDAMYEYNIETEELLFLDYVKKPSGSLAAHVTTDDQIYYQKGNSYWHMDWNTKKKEKVGTIPDGAVSIDGVYVTNDGRYLNPTSYFQTTDSKDFFNGLNVKRVMPVLDTWTGEWNTTFNHLFTGTPEQLVYGHPMINPVYPNLIFFCHEGSTEIPDRLWLGDVETGESRVLFEQAAWSCGKTGESSGHEMWGADGEQMFFVKFNNDTTLGQSGLVRVDKDGSNREYINDDYKYWHASVSDDTNWIAADTIDISYRNPLICLVNTRTSESYHLTSVYFTSKNTNHPYQPHPQISRDGTHIKWQMTDENDVLSIGYMDVSDIVNQETIGGRIELSEDVALVSYGNSDGESSQAVDEDDNTYWSAQAGKGLFFDLEGFGTGGTTGSITLDITYLDEGDEPIALIYTDGVHSSGELADREDENISIRRINTGQWKTQRVTLPDVNLQNACRFRTDICIFGGGDSPVSIRDVKVIHN